MKNPLIKLLTEDEQREVEEMLRTSAQLAAQNRCPVCGDRLQSKPCPDCQNATHIVTSMAYCPTCGGAGTVTICPNAPHMGA